MLELPSVTMLWLSAECTRKNRGKEGETIALSKLIGGNTSSSIISCLAVIFEHQLSRPGVDASRELPRLYFYGTHAGNVVSRFNRIRNNQTFVLLEASSYNFDPKKEQVLLGEEYVPELAIL